MQGIEILNKTPVMINNDKLVIIVFVLLGIALIVGCVAPKFDVKNEVLSYIFIGVFGLCLSLAFVVTIVYKEVKIPSDRYQYVAIIDDDVSINEVYEHYVVINKKGEIWILEDKEK